MDNQTFGVRTFDKHDKIVNALIFPISSLVMTNILSAESFDNFVKQQEQRQIERPIRYRKDCGMDTADEPPPATRITDTVSLVLPTLPPNTSSAATYITTFIVESYRTGIVQLRELYELQNVVIPIQSYHNNKKEAPTSMRQRGPVVFLA